MATYSSGELDLVILAMDKGGELLSGSSRGLKGHVSFSLEFASFRPFFPCFMCWTRRSISSLLVI